MNPTLPGIDHPDPGSPRIADRPWCAQAHTHRLLEEDKEAIDAGEEAKQHAIPASRQVRLALMKDPKLGSTGFEAKVLPNRYPWSECPGIIQVPSIIFQHCSIESFCMGGFLEWRIPKTMASNAKTAKNTGWLGVPSWLTKPPYEGFRKWG